jgi:ligand-binding sensor domain-containing protein/DNA-binding CsgD family transcriptional regulator
MKYRYYLYAVILFLIFPSILWSKTTPFYFISITTDENLPDNTIHYIYQDSKGFMWFCTGEGLTRYDGNDFKLFQKSSEHDGHSIGSNGINHIMEDQDGLFWISTTDNGINVFDPALEKFTYFSHSVDNNKSLSNNNIKKCFQDSDGNIWVCTLGSGLDLYNPETNSFTHFVHDKSDDNSLPNNVVTDIIEDSYDNLWIATDGSSITKFNYKSGKFSKYKTSFKGINLSGYYKSLLLTDNNTLWVATDGSGLYKFDINSESFTRYIQEFKNGSLNSNNLKGIVDDKFGNLLVISDGGGINYFDINKNSFTTITYNQGAKNGITTNALYSVFKDKNNNIWIGTFKGGLLLLKEDSRSFKIIKQGSFNEGLPHKSVLCAYIDSKGIAWYGTDGGGLTKFDPVSNNYKTYAHNHNNPFSISSNVVKDILEDDDGNLWIATFFGGLNKFDRKKEKFIRYQIGTDSVGTISSNNSWYLMHDSKKRLWIGNFSTGLDYYDLAKDKFYHIPQNYSDTNTLSHIQVSSLVEDNEGNIWVGTLAGLNMMDAETLKCRRFYHNKNNESSISNDAVSCLFYDSKNRLWIGTIEGGLNRMISPGRFKRLSSNEKLPSQFIQSIEEDDYGYLWVSTKKGLIRLNPETEELTNYSIVEDFIGNEFNWNSSTKDSNGNLYFGTIEGACVFLPEQKIDNSGFPSTYFTNVNVNNQSIKAGRKYQGNLLLDKSVTYNGELTLTPNEKSFTIEFSALEFNNPVKIRYKYKLIGFDKDWIERNHSQRRATYTNLPGGKYQFEVFSTNSSGVWSNDGAKLQITIIPPVYERKWFQGLTILLIMFVIAILYKSRLEKHRRRIIAESQKREQEFLKKRNTELKAEITSNTLLILNKNESLNLIKEKLKDLHDSKNDKLIINDLIRLIDNQLEVDDYWEQFQYNFDQIYANLLSRLKNSFPDLTHVNLKLCAFLRLNMSSKEIASLMNITKSGVDKARNRLRKKLNIDSDIDLYDFLIKF